MNVLRGSSRAEWPRRHKLPSIKAPQQQKRKAKRRGRSVRKSGESIVARTILTVRTIRIVLVHTNIGTTTRVGERRWLTEKPKMRIDEVPLIPA